MAMNTFVAHPSVRIKGTENNYEPIQCINPACLNKDPHMHCPFCVKTEGYHDPVILKAHYRVKHVDKGIEFGGLKVLRCCDHCFIVGSIKGTKEFKGAHWHCYRCRNGFNRRDEAFKHYRTHFRNPQTTFQIQVATEVNQMFSLNQETENATQVLNATESAILSTNDATSLISAGSSLVTVTSDLTHPALAGLVNGKATDASAGELQVSVAANETVGTSEPTTIMIQVEEDVPDASSITDTTIEHAEPIESVQEIGTESWQVAKGELEQRVAELTRQTSELTQINERLLKEKEQLQKELKLQATGFKAELEVQHQELSRSRQREQELVDQLSVPLDGTVSELLNSLKAQHEELLHQQLARLRQVYLQPFSPQPASGSILTLAFTPQTGSETQPAVEIAEQHNKEGPQTIQLKVTSDSVIPQTRTDSNGVYVYADEVEESRDTIMLVKTEMAEEASSDTLLTPVEVTVGQKRSAEEMREGDSFGITYIGKTKRQKES